MTGLHKSNYIQLAFLILLPAVLLHACTYGTPDPEPVPQTEILEIRMTPDTVVVGDTVLIHCVIEDSLDERFKFDWRLNEERIVPVKGTVNGPKIKWWAKGFEYLEPGEVQIIGAGSIKVDNGSVDSVAVRKLIDIPVRQTE